ncbi:hypothetical protein VTJ49DRAFT_7388 [Mycothermus thermophilus]|uniref:Uncharacterized protein n=1 Tax=Humicola insolens TaxID=85995 RepID=A0ABR3VGX9_HUMIN
MAHRPPTRRSSHDSWVVVERIEASSFSRDRSPQLNNRNKSSSEMASVSAKGGGCSALHMHVADLRIATTQGDDDDGHHNHYDAHPVPDHDDAHGGVREEGYHIPPSNATGESWETPTLTNVAALPAAVTASTAPPPSRSPACPPLTAANMARFQRDLAERCPCGIDNWRSAAGFHLRIGHDEGRPLSPANTKWSMYPASSGRSHAPSSVLGWDYMLPPRAAMMQDPDGVVVGAGAWSSEAKRPPKSGLSDDEF